MEEQDTISGQSSDPARDAETVGHGFWSKVRRTIGRVPFLADAIAAYYCARDSQTPLYVKAVLLGALSYFIVPTDMIPDFIAGVGYADDASVLTAAIATVRGHITPTHRQQAEETLARLTGQNEASS